MTPTVRWLTLGLVLSVVANLLLVGFLAGRGIGGTPPAAAPLDPSTGLFWMLQTANDERRAELLPVIRDARRQSRPRFRALRHQQREVFDALRDRTFDEARLRAALAALRSELDGAQQRSHELLTTISGRLTPEERGHLVRAMQRQRRDGRRGGPRPPRPRD